MAFSGIHKWTRILVTIIVAIFYSSVPANAKKSTKKSKPNREKIVKAPKEKKDSTKVRINADDPKAFTKALLLEKEGVEFEIVEKKKKKASPQKPPKGSKENKPEEFFDFSTILIPITHEAKLGSPYGIRDHRLHRGVDIQIIKDEPVVAAYPGKVIMSRYNKGGYGHYVLIKHPNGIETLYGHLSKRTLKVGDEVYPGDIVGLAGNTGRSSGAHLHFEIRYGEVNIDPATVIDFPRWDIKEGASHYSLTQATAAHRKIQNKLKNHNYYIVKKGDSQGDVANWFNISIESLCRLNKLKPGAPLKAGQKLYGSK